MTAGATPQSNGGDLAPVTVRGVWRSTFLLMVASTIATASGFLREAAVAYSYGTTPDGDAVALLLFGFDALAGLFASGLGTYVLVPYVARGTAVDPEEPGAVSATIVLGVVAVGFLAAIGVTIAPWLAEALGGSETGTALAAANLYRLAVLAFPLAALAGFAGAVLQGRGSFSAAPLSRVVFNAGNAGVLLLVAATLGAEGSAYALTAGVLAQALVLLWLVKRVGYPLTWRGLRLSPQLTTIARNALPALLVFVCANIALPGAERIILGLLPAGSLSAATYAWRVFYLFMAWALAFQSVSFTALSSHDPADGEGRGRIVLRDLRAATLLLLPMSIAAWLCRETMVSTLFLRGRFDAESAQITSTIFGWYILTLLPVHVFGAALRYQLALRNGWYALRMAASWVVLALAIDIATMKTLGVRAVPLGFGLSSVVVGTVGLVLLQREFATAILAPVAAFLLRTAVLSGIALAPLIAWRVLEPHAAGRADIRAIAGAAAAGLLAAGIYLGIGLASGMKEFLPIRDRLRRLSGAT